MKTLVLHAPKTQDEASHARDFETIVQTGIGPAYAIFSQLLPEIEEGCEVIVFSKDTKKQARGTLSGWAAVGKTRNHLTRYDFYIQGLENVPFNGSLIELNRCGVALI